MRGRFELVYSTENSRGMICRYWNDFRLLQEVHLRKGLVRCRRHQGDSAPRDRVFPVTLDLPPPRSHHIQNADREYPHGWSDHSADTGEPQVVFLALLVPHPIAADSSEAKAPMPVAHPGPFASYPELGWTQ